MKRRGRPAGVAPTYARLEGARVEGGYRTQRHRAISL